MNIIKIILQITYTLLLNLTQFYHIVNLFHETVARLLHEILTFVLAAIVKNINQICSLIVLCSAL